MSYFLLYKDVPLPLDGTEYLHISQRGKSFKIKLADVLSGGAPASFTFTAPSVLTLEIPFSTHGIESLTGVKIYDPDGNEVTIDVNINFSTNLVTLNSTINLLNSTIKIY